LQVRGDRKEGWRVLPTALPPRSAYMAAIGGPNLEGVVATLDAQRQGYDSVRAAGERAVPRKSSGGEGGAKDEQ
jgi:hypothetical protein